MSKSSLVLAVGLVAMATAASAADMRVKAPRAPAAVAEVYNWTGFYIGGQVGGAWADYRYDNISLTNERVSHSASSVVGGGHAGYNWQINQIVLGIEAEASAADLNGSSISAVNPVVSYSSKIDWYATVVGRFGFAFGRAMIYGTGGVAFADIRSSGVNGVVDSFSVTSQRTGWTAGAGLAYQLSPNWIASIDYKHLQFEKYDLNGVTRAAIPFLLRGVDARVDQVTARISYKFGGPVVAKY